MRAPVPGLGVSVCGAAVGGWGFSCCFSIKSYIKDSDLQSSWSIKLGKVQEVDI